MTYFVIDPSGASYGPADIPLLHQWAQEGRLLPTSTIRDAVSGQTMVARAIPGLFPDAGQLPYQPLPMAPSPYIGRPANLNSQELTIAWICAVCSIVLACACGPIGLLTGIAGAVLAKKALDMGNQSAQAPMIVSYVGIGLGAILTIISMGMRFL